MSATWPVEDLGTLRVPTSRWALGAPGRDALRRELPLADQFILLNRSVLNSYDVTCSLAPSKDGVDVILHTGQKIGALPLRSPCTGRYEFGLVISPRFGWRGVGALMTEVGAKVLPAIPRLPPLPRSEHEVPRWVLAAVVLARLEALVSDPQRRFLVTRKELDRPRGRVEWNDYVSRFVARNTPNRVPCEYTELTADARLLSTVHAAALAQLQSLQRVKVDSVVVGRLIARYERLREAVVSYSPSWSALSQLRVNLTSAKTLDAVEAMFWTHDERGLAGKAQLAGLPWRLSMEEVFEARVESLARVVALRTGGVVRSGRLRETQRALRWSPPYSGSQRTLLPDVEIVRDGETMLFDAKYKSHWEELESTGWHGLSEAARDSHRNDLLQILAYGGVAGGSRIVCVLFYPCHIDTWQSLVMRGRTVHRASVPAGERSVMLMLAAIPFERSLDDVATTFLREFEGVSAE